ncbi:MAG TPA: ergothioneine biosynthesis protein EgtC [Acidimicrobiales bacterium]|nr:ergothioneine biosynthesis protein EgtC [Acidimicrobiales bacterium]
MCRFVAYVGPAITLEALLLAPEHSLLRQAWAPRHQRHGTLNADGFGVGWYDLATRPEPARYRSARPMWADASFASLAGLTASEAVLGAVRSATPPLPVEETGAPPFTAGPWLFVHNGAVDGFKDGVGTELRRAVSNRREGRIEGASDAEVLFALVLDQLDAGARPDAALTAVMARVLALTTARLNLVVLDGKAVTATAYGASLYVRGGAGSGPPGLVVASEPFDDGPGWEAVPDGSLVEGTATSVTVSPLSLPMPSAPRGQAAPTTARAGGP